MAQEGESEIPQIAYYQAGIGTGDDILDKIGGGATGEGVNEHIREAYAFLALNWRQGTGGDPANDDELFLLGFSRGAFTARSVVGFISTVGLLTRRGMEYFYEIFKDYENMNIEDYKNPLSHHSDLQEKPRLRGDSASKRKYFQYLRNLPEPLTSERIPTVKALGVWDTVGMQQNCQRQRSSFNLRGYVRRIDKPLHRVTWFSRPQAHRRYQRRSA